MPLSGLTALHVLRDVTAVEPGQFVLMNGGSGGIGTFAVQIAAALGAEATGVWSTRNVDLVRGLGAAAVVDDARDDSPRGASYDVILDDAGNHPLAAGAGALRHPHAEQRHHRRPVAGTPADGGARTGRVAVRGSAPAPFVSMASREDLETLTAMIDAGDVRPVIRPRVPAEDTAEALPDVAGGHTRGKVITV